MITFTQGHPDHVGGWSQFNQPGVETIAQANHSDVREYWRHLHPFYVRRIMTLWGAFMDVETAAATLPAGAGAHRFVHRHATRSNLGGRRFELYSTPGGETTDALVVWMPEHRTVFIGNLMGPFFGHVPNLYTLRGDKIRSAMTFIHSVGPGDRASAPDAHQRPRRLPRRRQDPGNHDQGARRDDIPARSHHRRDELGRRPVDVDA